MASRIDNPEATTTSVVNEYYDPLLAGATQKAEEAEAYATAQEQQAADALARYNQALEQGHSGMRALLQKQEPKRDTNKEERLRKAAIVQAFGDMAVAMTRGVAAFNKKSGAGYVPQGDLNSPLASINELNRMRDLYLQQRKEWDGMMLDAEQNTENARIAAAQSMATVAQRDAEDARRRADKAVEDKDRIARDKAQAELRAIERAEDKDFQERLAEKRASLGGGSGSGSRSTESYTSAGYIYYLLHKDDTYDETRVSPVSSFDDDGNSIMIDQTTTTTKPVSLTIKDCNALGKYDYEVAEVVRLINDEGLSREEAVERVKAER